MYKEYSDLDALMILFQVLICGSGAPGATLGDIKGHLTLPGACPRVSAEGAEQGSVKVLNNA